MTKSDFKETPIESLVEEIAMGPFGSNIKTDCFVDRGVPVFNGSNLAALKPMTHLFAL